MTSRVLAVAAVATLLAAATARASTARVELAGGHELVFTAEPGERNEVLVRVIDGETFAPTYEIRDKGTTVVAGEHCTTVDEHTARCRVPAPLIPGPVQTMTSYRVALGDGDDRVSVDDANAGFTRLVAEGGPGDDELLGGHWHDTLDGGPGRDLIRGGPGTDTVSYAGRSRAVLVILDQPDGHGEPGEEDAVTEVEDILGGSGDDRLVGDNGPNRIDGGPGRDRLIGRRGDDILVQGGGRISCGEGDDTVLSPLLGFFGSTLVDHLEPGCERIMRSAVSLISATQPTALRLRSVGLRISCPSPDVLRRCHARVRIVDLSDRRRLLGAGRLERGRWTGRLVRIRLTPLGRRRVASMSDRSVGVELDGGRHGIIRWTFHLNRPA